MLWERGNLEAAEQWNFSTGVEKPCYISLNKDRYCTYSLPAWLYIKHRHSERTSGNIKGHFHQGSVDAQRKYMTAQRNVVLCKLIAVCGCMCWLHQYWNYSTLIDLDEEEDYDIVDSVWCVGGCPCSKRGGFFMKAGSWDAHESLMSLMQSNYICKNKTINLFFFSSEVALGLYTKVWLERTYFECVL